MTAASTPAPPTTSRAPLGKAFWWLWTASTAANLGDGIRLVGFPLLAITVTRNPLLVSAVAAATTLPWLLVGPLAGLAVDRWDRLRLLWIANALRATTVVVLVGALATDQLSIWLLIAAAALLGAGETFVDTTAQALVPRLVHADQLERANSSLYGAQVLTNQFLGQGITGLLFAWAVITPFALDAFMLTVATAAALTLAVGWTPQPQPRRRERPLRGRTTGAETPGSTAHRREGTAALTNAFADIGVGGRWLWCHPLLRGLWLMIGALGWASGAFWGVIALYAAQVLDLGAAGFGIMLAVGATGALLGSQLAPTLRNRLGTTGAIHLAIALIVIAAIGFALNRSGVLAAGLMVLNGIGVLVWNVLGVSLRQRLVPDHLLGRVNAAFSMVAVGSASAGALSAGLLATATGSLPAVFWASAAVIAVPALLTARSLRAADHPMTASNQNLPPTITEPNP